MSDRNALFARTLVAALAAAGVEHACVTPGSRNTPLSIALADSAIEDWSHQDERSAAFFALGLARSTGGPVVIATTSGTAATELHPALAEAGAARVPLIAITADRPAELRDVGAPQTIDQSNLFGPAVKWCHDIEAAPTSDVGQQVVAGLAVRLVVTACTGPAGPVHLNVRFRPPLLIDDEPVPPVDPPTVAASEPTQPSEEAVSAILEQLSDRSGVIIAGPQPDPLAPDAVVRVATELGWPVMADPLSGLRAGRNAGDAVVGSDLLAAHGWLDLATPEAVLRLGAVPTSKSLRSWLSDHRAVPQVFIEPHGWRDPAASSRMIVRADVTATLDAIAAAAAAAAPPAWSKRWTQAQRRAEAAARGMIDQAPFPNEPGAVVALEQAMPSATQLWAASSMPVRDVDSFFPVTHKEIAIRANRGANGIDGFVSTSLGAAAAGQPVFALAGDLSMLHDIGAMATMQRLRLPLTVLVVNNDGGGIFHFLPQAGHRHFERHFGTPHGLSFAPIATTFGVEAHVPADAAELGAVLAEPADGPRLIEVVTDRAANTDLHRAVAREVRAALETA